MTSFNDRRHIPVYPASGLPTMSFFPYPEGEPLVGSSIGYFDPRVRPVKAVEVVGPKKVTPRVPRYWRLDWFADPATDPEDHAEHCSHLQKHRGQHILDRVYGYYDGQIGASNQWVGYTWGFPGKNPQPAAWASVSRTPPVGSRYLLDLATAGKHPTVISWNLEFQLSSMFLPGLSNTWVIYAFDPAYQSGASVELDKYVGAWVHESHYNPNKTFNPWGDNTFIPFYPDAILEIQQLNITVRPFNA